MFPSPRGRWRRPGQHGVLFQLRHTLPFAHKRIARLSRLVRVSRCSGPKRRWRTARTLRYSTSASWRTCAGHIEQLRGRCGCLSVSGCSAPRGAGGRPEQRGIATSASANFPWAYRVFCPDCHAESVPCWYLLNLLSAASQAGRQDNMCLTIPMTAKNGSETGGYFLIWKLRTVHQPRKTWQTDTDTMM